MGWLICLIIFGLTTITGIAMKISTQNTSDYPVPLIVVMVLLNVFFFIKYRKSQAVNIAEKKRMKELAKRTVTAKHHAGLPLSPGTICNIIYEKGCISITGGGNSFELAKNKITDISPGPISGQSTVVYGYGSYLIITYRVGEEIKYIRFKFLEEDYKSRKKAKKWREELSRQAVGNGMDRTIQL